MNELAPIVAQLLAAQILSRLNTRAWAFTGDITPTALAAATHNWDPTGLSTATVIRMSASSAVDLTGLAGGADGRLMIIHNVGSFAVTLKNESASSTAANRFALTADISMATDAVAVLQYDSTSSRWRAVSGGGGAVTSVFSRTGAVVATSGDYTAAQVTNVAAGGIVAVTVQAAIDELDTEKTAKATLTTKGDLYAATGAGTVVRLGVGSNGQVLTANSSATEGMDWQTPGATASVGGLIYLYNNFP